MTSYFNTCDVTVANSNHKIFYSFSTCTCAPHFGKGSATHGNKHFNLDNPVSSEISDLCEISDLLLLINYFAAQSKGKKFGDCFF